jgi:3-hydroxyisobutyrate dehydrogenase-like beta-hydroxyacid dehydrogenase
VSPTRVGVIGLGAMGRPMANAVIAAGHPVLVFDRRPEAIDQLVTDGAMAAGSPRALAAGSDVVITMLPRPEDVVDAVTASDGIAAGLGPGGTLLEASTIDVGTVRDLEQPLRERGGHLLDAGVSGSPSMAWRRDLTLIVGGEEAVIGRHRAVLDAIAARVIVAGPLGAAKAMKLANNLVAAVTTAALAEAFTLASRAGADPARAFEAMEVSWAASALLRLRPPLPGLQEGSPADRGYQGEFSIDYMAKDLAAILESAHQAGAVLPTTDLVHGLFMAASTRGDGALDLSALIRTIDGFGRPT